MKNSGLEAKGSFSVGDNPAEYDVTFEEREQALQKITEMQEKLHRKERHSPYERFAQTNLDGTDKLIALTQKNALETVRNVQQLTADAGLYRMASR